MLIRVPGELLSCPLPSHAAQDPDVCLDKPSLGADLKYQDSQVWEVGLKWE